MKEKTIYIPIGTDCRIANYLRSDKIRYQAFPFDWVGIEITTVLSLINNKFEGFLDLENLQFLPPVERKLITDDGTNVKIINDIITPVVCHRYNILFVHDFSVAGIDDYAKIKEKYTRRIEKLMNLIETEQELVFVYNNKIINDWALEQHSQSGKKFEIDSEQEIKEFFKTLQLKNAKLMSLDDLIWSRMTLKKLPKYSFNKFKEKVSPIKRKIGL